MEQVAPDPATKPDRAHYSIHRFDDEVGIQELRRMIPVADSMNWLFLSTGGIHGHYGVLDEVEERWDEPDTEDDHHHNITVLVVKPRMVMMHYGTIELRSMDDIQFLRERVTETLDAVAFSQIGNKAEEKKPTDAAMEGGE